MRPIKLLFYSMSESFLKVLLLIVTSAVSLIYSLYALSLLSEYYEVIYNTMQANLTDKVVVYTDLTDEYENEGNYKEILEQINTLSSMEAIQSVVPFNDCWGGFSYDGCPGGITLTDVSFLGDCDYPFHMVAGRAPDVHSINEVVVTENGTDHINIGDEIEIPFYSYEYSEDDDTYYWVPGKYMEDDVIYATIKVVGVISADSPLVQSNSRHFPSILTERFMPLSEQDYIWAIAWNLRTDDGKAIRTTTFGGLLITPGDGYSPEDVADLLVDAGFYAEAQVTYYDEMLTNYQAENGELRAAAIRNSLLAVLLSVTVVFCSINMSIKKKRNELTTYYLCGSTWSGCIAGELLIFIPSIIIGTISGYAVLLRYSEQMGMLINANYLTVEWLLIMLAFNLLIVVLLMVPTLIINSRRHPIELMRKD